MNFCLKIPDLHVTFRDLLHDVNLWHVTNGFTSLPKKGVLRIFLPWKILRLRSGLNPRTWVRKASTLPLDHRSSSMLLRRNYVLETNSVLRPSFRISLKSFGLFWTLQLNLVVHWIYSSITITFKKTHHVTQKCKNKRETNKREGRNPTFINGNMP